MKYIFYVCLGALLVLALLWWFDDSDTRLAEITRKLELKELEYTALVVDDKAKQAALVESTQAYRELEANKKADRARLDNENSALVTEISKLRANQDRLREQLQKDSAELPSLSDVDMARRSLVLLQAFAPVGLPPPELEAKADLFTANRSYVESASYAGLSAVFFRKETTSLQHEVTICNTMLRNETQAKEGLIQVAGSCDQSLVKCYEALQTAHALTDNANVRIAAQAERAKLYEKKWKLERLKGWGKTALAAAAGILIGRAL